MMGAGIAYATASKGIAVVLKDVSLENAEKGKAYSQKLLDKKVPQGRLSAEQRDQVLGLIHATAEAADLQGCDLIIEAVFENQQLKAQDHSRGRSLSWPMVVSLPPIPRLCRFQV